jgi:hypothetical protein
VVRSSTAKLPWTPTLPFERLPTHSSLLFSTFTMTALIHRCRRAFWIGAWCLAMMVLLLGLSGCAGHNVREDRFSDNDLSQSVRKARPEKSDAEHHSLTEKGRQIERDLNAM